jgi:hypothetical protein
MCKMYQRKEMLARIIWVRPRLWSKRFNVHSNLSNIYSTDASIQSKWHFFIYQNANHQNIHHNLDDLAITNRLGRQGHTDELLVDGADVRLAALETDPLGRHYRKELQHRRPEPKPMIFYRGRRLRPWPRTCTKVGRRLGEAVGVASSGPTAAVAQVYMSSA